MEEKPKRRWAIQQIMGPRSRDQRDRLVGMILLLGILGSLPEPQSFVSPSANILVAVLWLMLTLVTVTLGFFPQWIGLSWFASFALSLLAFLKLKTVYPLAMVTLWGVWFWVRTRRGGKIS